MKRALFIITGSSILVVIFLTWLYLLLFGTPAEVREVFTNFNLPGESTTPIPVAVNDEPPARQVNVSGSLVQLTTRPVAGFIHISSTSTDDRLRYAEQGTGHIYEINLSSGTETRISGTTVGQTVGAHFKESGEMVVLLAETAEKTTVGLYRIGSTASKVSDLPDNSASFYFTGESSINYTLAEADKTTAYSMDWEDVSTDELWSVPLTDIRTIWTSGQTFITNKTAPYLSGGVYGIVSGKLSQIIPPQPALSAIIDGSGRHILYSAFDREYNQVVSRTLDRQTGEAAIASMSAIPEKCVFMRNEIWCASSFELTAGDREALSAWYRGEFVSSDSLWKQSLTASSAQHVESLSKTAGFDIDITNMTVFGDSEGFLFTNKTNNTLWIKRLAGTSTNE